MIVELQYWVVQLTGSMRVELRHAVIPVLLQADFGCLFLQADFGCLFFMFQPVRLSVYLLAFRPDLTYSTEQKGMPLWLQRAARGGTGTQESSSLNPLCGAACG